MNEFEAPPDWSRWTASRFQTCVAAFLAIIAAYGLVLLVSEENRGFAFIVVSLLICLVAAATLIERYHEKNSAEPNPDAPNILKRLPYLPYEGDYERLTDNDEDKADQLDNDWDELVRELVKDM